MIARAMPFAGIASRKAVASSGGIGFVRRSIRGLREKIWIASAPTDLPRSGASAMLSAMETWAPRNMLPRAAIAYRTDELADLGNLGPRARHVVAYAAASFRAFTTGYDRVSCFSPRAHEPESHSRPPSSTHRRTPESPRT